MADKGITVYKNVSYQALSCARCTERTGVDLDHVVEQTQEVQLWKMQSRCLNLEKDDEEHGNFV